VPSRRNSIDGRLHHFHRRVRAMETPRVSCLLELAYACVVKLTCQRLPEQGPGCVQARCAHTRCGPHRCCGQRERQAGAPGDGQVARLGAEYDWESCIPFALCSTRSLKCRWLERARAVVCEYTQCIAAWRSRGPVGVGRDTESYSAFNIPRAGHYTPLRSAPGSWRRNNRLGRLRMRDT